MGPWRICLREARSFGPAAVRSGRPRPLHVGAIRDRLIEVECPGELFANIGRNSPGAGAPARKGPRAVRTQLHITGTARLCTPAFPLSAAWGDLGRVPLAWPARRAAKTPPSNTAESLGQPNAGRPSRSAARLAESLLLRIFPTSLSQRRLRHAVGSSTDHRDRFSFSAGPTCGRSKTASAKGPGPC